MRKSPELDGSPAPLGPEVPAGPPSSPDLDPRADPAEELGDARLVEQARLGNDSAFGILVQRYERKLIRVLARLVQDDELARDLAQETFWKVYSRLDRFDTSRRFGPWLFRVGMNLGLDQLRRLSLPSVSIDRARSDGGRTSDLPEADPRVREELAQEVRFVLDRLPVDYRSVLILRDLEGFSSAEVASIIGRQEATVRWRLARAREMFRQHWERRQDSGPGEARHARP